MITVCHVVHNLSVGGAELLAAGISRGLKSRHRFVFACLDNDGELAEQLRAEGVPVYAMGRRPGADWRCVKRIWSLLRSERVDVIHAHQYAPFFYSAAPGALVRRPPVLFTEHGRTYPDFRRAKRVLANRLVLSKRDRVVGVGESVRKALIDNEGFAADRVSVVYNGVNVDLADNARDVRELARGELGIGENEIAILHVARLDPLKDHVTALRAMQLVTKCVPQARLILVGDGPERAAIESRIEELGISPAVMLLGTRHDVPRLWQAADIAVLSSVSEGVPLTLLEAMAAGIPVVATRVGGVGEVVVAGRTGELADKQDFATLAEHLIRLAMQPKLRRELGGAGRRRVVERFSAERMLQEYDRLYCELGASR